MWSTRKVTGYISPVSLQRRHSTALPVAHHWQVRFLSDITAFPKRQQQLLSSVLPSCLCAFYCQIFSNIQQHSANFAMTKDQSLWRNRKTYVFRLPLSKGKHVVSFVLVGMPLPQAFAPFLEWHCCASHKHHSCALAGDRLFFII